MFGTRCARCAELFQAHPAPLRGCPRHTGRFLPADVLEGAQLICECRPGDLRGDCEVHGHLISTAMPASSGLPR